MIPHLLEMGIAISLALGFAAVGEGVLRKRSRGALGWTQSFLVGAGVLAATLFPLSLLLPHGALRATLAVMALGVVRMAWFRVFGKADEAVTEERGLSLARDVPSIILGAMVAVVAVGFIVLSLRSTLVSDGFLTWASKAQLLYYRGGLGREWFPGFDWESRVLPYPSMVPLYEALLCCVRGSFDFDALEPVFVIFYLSMLISTYSAARSTVSRPRALSATLLLALLPAVFTGVALGGYADMPQAACVAGVVVAGLRESPERNGWRSPLAWLIGSLTMIKAEGTLLAGIACLSIAFWWCFARPHRFLSRVLAEWRGAAVIGGFLAVRWSYARWLNVPSDGTYGPLDHAHLTRALGLLGPVARLCLNMLGNPLDWALLWSAFLLAFLTLLALGSLKERCLAAATAGAIVAYSAIFLFTNWPVEVHIPNVYDRLLVHLAPAAAVSAVLAYARAVPDVVAKETTSPAPPEHSLA